MKHQIHGKEYTRSMMMIIWGSHNILKYHYRPADQWSEIKVACVSTPVILFGSTYCNRLTYQGFKWVKPKRILWVWMDCTYFWRLKKKIPIFDHWFNVDLTADNLNLLKRSLLLVYVYILFCCSSSIFAWNEW